jgi:hypothetical protein
VTDEQAAESQLLRHILDDPRVMVTDFTLKKYELEEAFIEIVKGNNHDSQ